MVKNLGNVVEKQVEIANRQNNKHIKYNRRKMDNNLSKEEFKVILMLYVANSDGRVNLDEVRAMLERTSPKVYSAIRLKFDKMNDMEVLQCIEEHKKHYFTTDEERQELFEDLKSVVEADGKLLPVEEYMLRGISGVM
jgi:uncharacterized tellurite resistance protein B-like protein